MSREALKSRIEQALADFSEPATRDAYMSIYAPSVKLHGLPPDVPPTYEGLYGFYRMLWAAFPDIRLRAEDMVIEGERVAVRYAWTATHKGEFMGIPATGKRVEVEGITILNFADGQIVERWQASDMLGFMTALGMTLVPAQAAASV